MAWMGGYGGAPHLEGTLDSVFPVAGAGLELELVSGTNQSWVEVENAAGNSPALHSRLRSESRSVPDWGSIQLLTGTMLSMARNVADLRRIGAVGQHEGCVVEMSGQVLAVSDSGEFLAFKDDTGVMLLALPRT